MIASACYPFNSVLKAMAEPSFLLPAEGMPGARYLPGAEIMDVVEDETEQLILDLFNNSDDYRATIQPHSGTQANQIVYNAILNPDDEVVCLRPKDGGHISHTVLIARRHTTHYFGLTDYGDIDYEGLEQLAKRIKPKLIIIGGSALPRALDFHRCSAIARAVGAYLHGDISHVATFIACEQHQSAFPYCDFATFSTSKNLRGPNSGVLIYRRPFQDKVFRSIFPTTQGGANETNMLGQYACFLEWKKSSLERYAQRIVEIGRLMCMTLMNRGLEIITNGTDSHIVLIKLPNTEKTGADYEVEFEKRHVLLNKNQIPSDSRPPMKTSGLRIGVTNLAILQFSNADVVSLSEWIAGVVLHEHVNPKLIDTLINRYPAPFDWAQT